MSMLPQVRLKTWFSAVVLLLLLQHAAAAEPFAPYVWKPSPTDPRSYENFEQRHRVAIDSGETDVVVCASAEDLRGLSAWEGTDQDARTKLQGMLDARCKDFQAWLQSPIQFRTLDFISTGWFKIARLEEAWYCFYGTPQQFTLEGLSRDNGEDISYRVDVMDKLMVRFRKPMMKRMVRAIETAKTRWEISLGQRYAQYPWEMVANSKWINSGDIEHPPLRQWIFFHPELGVEISGNKFTEFTAKEALTLETLGHLWYRWRDEAKPAEGLSWLGLSGVLTFRSDVGTGIGVMGHWNKLVNAGVVWHDFNRDGRYFNDKMAFTVSIDLYRFAQREVPKKAKQFKAELDEVKDRWEKAILLEEQR